MTPGPLFSSVAVPAYLADEFRRRAHREGLCADEVLIRLLSDWVSSPEPKVDWGDLAKALYEVAQDLASRAGADSDAQHLARGYARGELRRCQNCGIRVPKVLRIKPWKACSEDCVDALRIKELIHNSDTR